MTTASAKRTASAKNGNAKTVEHEPESLLDQVVESTVQRQYDKISDPIASATQIGKDLHQAGLATTPGGGTVVAMICFTEGISFREFMRKYHKFDGTLTMRAGAAYADFIQQGGTVEFIQQDEKACIGKWSFGNFKDVEIGFTIEEAERAGLLKKDNWQNYRSDMLFNRCIMRALRRIAPSIVAGVYDPDEVERVPTPSVSVSQTVASHPGIQQATQAATPATTATSPQPEPQKPESSPVTHDQLVKIVDLGRQMGKSPDDVKSQIELKYGCTPQELTEELAAGLIRNLEKVIAQKKSEAATTEA